MKYRKSIKILYIVDDTFKEICDDYCTSKLHVLKFQKKFEKNFEEKILAENLSVELEEEILLYFIKKIQH